MTKQEIINALRTKRNEIIPPKLEKGVEVFMSKESGIEGYGNVQCVKDVVKEIGVISLYGHNTNPGINTVREILGKPVALQDLFVIVEKKEGFVTDGYIRKGINNFIIQLFPRPWVGLSEIRYAHVDLTLSIEEQPEKNLVELWNIIK